PDIQAVGGLVVDDDPWFSVKFTGEKHLLDVPAGQLTERRVRTSRPDLVAADQADGVRFHLLPALDPVVPEGRIADPLEQQVESDGIVRHPRLAQTIIAEIAQALLL